LAERRRLRGKRTPLKGEKIGNSRGLIGGKKKKARSKKSD